MTRPKETDFFSSQYERGLDWFSEQYLSHYQAEPAVGEASPENMRRRGTAANIADCCPDARLIFILRDPVERIWSHYRLGIYLGHLPPTADFSELIRDKQSEWRQRMVDIGMYKNHLDRYLTYFDEEQIKIFLFKEVVKNTNNAVKKIFDFIGVDSKLEVDTGEAHMRSVKPENEELYRVIYSLWEPFKQHLPNSAMEMLSGLRGKVRGYFFQSTNNRTEKSRMLSSDREYLSGIYANPNEELKSWLGRDLSHWD